MTDVKMKALNLAEFDKVERLVNNIGKDVAAKVFAREAHELVESMQSQITDSDASWGEGIDRKKASDSLASALEVQPGEGSVTVTFKEGTHPETGKKFKEVAVERDKSSSFRKRAVEDINKKKKDIGDKVLKEQLRIIRKVLGA